MGSLLQKLFAGLACSAFLSACGPTYQWTARKVSNLPDHSPLAMSTGGRMSTTVSETPDHFGGSDYTSQWPGSYFRASFEGARVFFRVVSGDEILHIVIDGQMAAPLVKPDAGVYAIEGLSNGKHEIEALVATESQAGPNTFGGFAIPSDEKALKPPQRYRQIEFIGDSQTVGYGDLSSRHECSTDEVWADTDNTKAFGPIAANHYDADYQINAISGRGVVRNYDGFKADTLPQAYPYVLFDKKEAYNDPAWKPEVLVVGLGTNDFSTALNPGERWKTRDELHSDYEATYLQFLQGLRAKNRSAYIIVWATNAASGEVKAEAQKVVQLLKERGDEHITFLPVNGLRFGACNWHPSLRDQKAISNKLVNLIDADKQVWQNR